MSWMTADWVQRQERWQHQADALAGPGRRHGKNVLGAVVAQVAAIVEAEHDALTAQESARS